MFQAIQSTQLEVIHKQNMKIIKARLKDRLKRIKANLEFVEQYA